MGQPVLMCGAHLFIFRQGNGPTTKSRIGVRSSVRRRRALGCGGCQCRRTARRRRPPLRPGPVTQLATVARQRSNNIYSVGVLFLGNLAY
jgi:hypothetical protein